MAPVKTALVIGGGIAGPVVALALRKAGIEPTVYEAYARRRTASAACSSSRRTGSTRCASSARTKRSAAIGQPIERMVMADGRGQRFGEFAGLPGLPPSQALWRVRALPRAARARRRARRSGSSTASGWSASTRRRAASPRASPTAAPRRGDVLIGADGIRSTVRTLIDPDAPAPEVRRRCSSFGGYGRHAVARREPDADVLRLRPRAFLGYWAQPDGSTAWFSNLPHAEPMPIGARRARCRPADWLRRLRERHADDVPGRDLVAQHASAERAVRARLDGDHAEGAALAPRTDGAGRRRRARAIVKLGPGRVARHRERDRAGALPARPARRAAPRSRPTSGCAGRGSRRSPRGAARTNNSKGARARSAATLMRVADAGRDADRPQAGADARRRARATGSTGTKPCAPDVAWIVVGGGRRTSDLLNAS